MVTISLLYAPDPVATLDALDAAYWLLVYAYWLHVAHLWYRIGQAWLARETAIAADLSTRPTLPFVGGASRRMSNGTRHPRAVAAYADTDLR